MQRPARSNAGIAAPRFSQDESLYAAAQKRHHVELAPCHRCSRVHRSDKETDRCNRSRDAELCLHCGQTHYSDASKVRCSKKKRRYARPISVPTSPSELEQRQETEFKFNRNIADFRRSLDQQVMLYCKHCSEAWFSTKPADAVSVGSFFVTDRCSNCKKPGSLATASHAERFSTSNGMQPMLRLHCLPALTEIEEALISLHAPVLRVYRLRGGQLGFGGSCVSLTQDVGAIARSLPRSMEELGWVIFIKSFHVSEEGGEAVRKEFRVRRAVILAWLNFLTKHNPLYSHVQIQHESIDALPVDSDESIEHLPMRQNSDVEPLVTDSGQLIPSGEISHMILEGLVDSSFNSSEEALKERVVLDWPVQSKDCVKEFGNPGLFAKCFPSIFPYGIGDPTSKTRHISVSLSDGIHHLQKYAYVTLEQKLVWPFAQHRIAPFYAHDVHLRQALLGQSAIFLKQNENADAEFPASREAFLEALQDPTRSSRIMKLINRYAGNCLGTNGYWSRRKEELVSLCEAKAPHLWWTLSAADLHWPDLRRFVDNITQAPHLVDAWFYIRVQEYVKWFFGEECEWIWWRIEYQSRGSAHAHGCVRIKNFVDLDALYEIARNGHRDGATATEISESASAELQLCHIADQFCSAMAVDPAGDALFDTRSKAVFEPNSVHPASFVHEDHMLDMIRFGDLLNKVQRHAHVKTYCGCDGEGPDKCRFHAPWRITKSTCFEWTMTDKGPKGFIQYMRNDRWMNTYHPVGMQAWNANMDIKLIYNVDCLAEYLCSYATKCEKLSKQAIRVMSACSNHFDDTTGIQKIVRSMFIKGHGQRDMSAQEVAHCNMNMPLVRQNVKYITLDMRKGTGVGQRRLDLDDNASSMVVPSIMEWYGRRCNESAWAEAYKHCAQQVENVSLHDFVLEFNNLKTQKLAPRARQGNDIYVINALPRIRAPRDGNLYPEYCRLQLILHHPWTDDPPWLADSKAVELWEHFGGNIGLLDAAIVAAVARQDIAAETVLSVDSAYDELQGVNDAVFKEASETFDDVAWLQVHHYEVSTAYLTSSLENSKKAAQDQRSLSEKRNVSLDATQQSVVDAFCASSNRLMLLVGAGGTGKSEVVFRIKENLGDCVLVTATTGKAAALIDGATVHCSINAPVKPKDKKSLSGVVLEKLQCRMKHVTHLIIDEFSMINGEFLYWIDQRLQQAKHCNEPFGGLSVLLAGDPAQLVPMGGTPLWVESEKSSSFEALGKCLYRMFNTVFVLTTNYRQGTANAHDLADFLANYRKGVLSEENWTWFESRSRDHISDHEYETASEAGIHLYPTNDQVKERNVDKLRQHSAKLGNSVAIFPAKNSCAKAASASNKLAGGLDKVVSLCVGASVMVTQNLWTEEGIVNGATGRIVDFVKDGDECVVIIVEIPKYRGPPLCGNDAQRGKWVPIPRKEATWIFGKKAQTCKREQFPLVLSFAITIHKSQGSSFSVPIVMDIGQSDRTCGSTYVAMSRCTQSQQIFHGGYARERIMKNFNSPAFKCRMKEEQRLLKLHSQRVHNYFTTE